MYFTRTWPVVVQQFQTTMTTDNHAHTCQPCPPVFWVLHSECTNRPHISYCLICHTCCYGNLFLSISGPPSQYRPKNCSHKNHGREYKRDSGCHLRRYDVERHHTANALSYAPQPLTNDKLKRAFEVLNITWQPEYMHTHTVTHTHTHTYTHTHSQQSLQLMQNWHQYHVHWPAN